MTYSLFPFCVWMLLQLSLRRRATLYIVNLFAPSFFLISLDLFSFLLPPKGVERFFYKVTLILGYIVFMLNTNDLLPVTGDAIPLTSQFTTTSAVCRAKPVMFELEYSPQLILTERFCVAVISDVFLSLCLALMAASLLETIFVTNLCHSAHDCPVPHWVHVFVFQFLGCLVCFHQKPVDVGDTIFENPAAEGETSTQLFISQGGVPPD